ncbi:MAG: C4-dicarboxylate ABC transporter, partial [Firmicutes bacterium]|nr:C4-dicarboxylate ABC transporter [Bacillota bacterium]
WAVDWKGSLAVLEDPIQSMFLGAVPMALATIVNGFVLIGPHIFGAVSLRIGFALWVFTVLMAVGSGILVPFYMFVSQDHRLDRITGLWLMPIVPAEVAAASGSLLMPYFIGTPNAMSMMIINLGLWALSVPLSFLILGFLFLRLALHKLPAKEMAISTWISLGTLGTGIMGLMGLSKYMPDVFGSLGHAMAGGAILLACVFWGLGLWWFTQSILITLYYSYSHEGLPFNLGWWGLTFPLGVFTGGTDDLFSQLHAAIIGDFAKAFFVLLVLFWGMVFVRTFHGLWTGSLWPNKTVSHNAPVQAKSSLAP